MFAANSLAPLMGEALSRPEVGLNGAEPEAAEKLFAGSARSGMARHRRAD